MQQPVILTCAVTGGDDTAGRFPAVPVTPAQIATAAIEACEAGAAIAHIHVRNPETGKPSMEAAHYREVVDRIRDSGSPVIVNLTTGPGARFVPSDVEANRAEPGSNLRPPIERVHHIVELKPEICSLDLGTLNFGKGALVNVPSHVETIAAAIRGARVKPELEVFDTGHIALALDMIRRGLLEPDAALSDGSWRSLGRAGDDRDHGVHEEPAAPRVSMGCLRRWEVAVPHGCASRHTGRPH